VIEPRLPARLRAVAALVPTAARRVADVGAGHGALSVHLSCRGAAVIAVESQTGPLAELRANLRSWDAASHVEVRHGDGLTALQPGEVDAVVVAGVGGGTALRIVAPSAAMQVRWLVLQCMQRGELVEPWLTSRRWTVLERRDVRDGRRTYPAWLVEVAA